VSFTSGWQKCYYAVGCETFREDMVYSGTAISDEWMEMKFEGMERGQLER